MADNASILNAAVSLVRAALIAARFPRGVHRRNLKRLAATRPRMWHRYASVTTD
jgi:hypothetical protein